jgi:hypothetical protein
LTETPGPGTISLRVLSLPEAEAREIPLPFGEPSSACSFHLRCLPGASRIHFVLTGGTGLRAEIPAESGETVTVHAEIGSTGELRVRSPGKKLFTLPMHSRYEPLPPLTPAGLNRLDMMFVIDSTTRRFTDEGSGLIAEPLLERKDLWQEQVAQLVRLVELLMEPASDVRVSVLAFGDRPPPIPLAGDLKPRFRLHPEVKEDRHFVPLDLERLRAALESIPSTPGGDFVDALADALQAARSLHWRKDARKILVVCGDSPGHSTLQPLRRGADLCARVTDVDTEAWYLHREKIEISTVYFAPPAALFLSKIDFQRDLLRATRAQYARLASLPTLAFETSTFSPEEVAEALRSRNVAIARGAALGELVGVMGSPPGVEGTDSSAARRRSRSKGVKRRSSSAG